MITSLLAISSLFCLVTIANRFLASSSRFNISSDWSLFLIASWSRYLLILRIELIKKHIANFQSDWKIWDNTLRAILTSDRTRLEVTSWTHEQPIKTLLVNFNSTCFNDCRTNETLSDLLIIFLIHIDLWKFIRFCEMLGKLITADWYFFYSKDKTSILQFILYLLQLCSYSNIKTVLFKDFVSIYSQTTVTSKINAKI